MITVYGIPNCDTVKRARAWLAAQQIEHRFHDFKKEGVPPQALAHWIEVLGWEPLINRRGTTWRQLDEAARAGLGDAASAAALAQAHPSLIKRPVVQWAAPGRVTVGFDAAQWQAARAG